MKSYVKVRLKAMTRNGNYLCPTEITMLQSCPKDYFYYATKMFWFNYCLTYISPIMSFTNTLQILKKSQLLYAILSSEVLVNSGLFRCRSIKMQD